MKFPQLSATNLEGEKFCLPDDLDGQYNLVLVAFLREHQFTVDSWIPFLNQLHSDLPNFTVYELPVLKRFGAFNRWMINSGMRAGIPNVEVRKHTITLYLDKAEFRQQLAIPDETSIHILLLDANGEIQWRTTGAYDEEKGNALRKVLMDLIKE